MTGISIETLEPWASSLWEARQRIRRLSLLAGAMSPAKPANVCSFPSPTKSAGPSQSDQVAVYLRKGAHQVAGRSANGRFGEAT